MEDFLKDYYPLLIRTVEFIAAITAIIVYNKYKNTKVKYFLWFLIFVFITELIGSYTVYVHKYEFLSGVKTYLKGTLIETNHWWYNIFWRMGSALFFSTYFIKVIENKQYKKSLVLIRGVFLVSSIVYIVFNSQEFFKQPVLFIAIFGAIVILSSSVLYFLEILYSDKILDFYKSVHFYIAAVIFIWFLITTPTMFYRFYYSQADWNFVLSRRMIYFLCNTFMYFSFSIALLFCKPENKSLLDKK